MELTIDKAFDELCPQLTADEYRILKAGIIADGCLQPIIVWANHEDTILDGHNRYRICVEHEIPFKTKALAFKTRADAEAWIIRNQLGRRNLTDGARAMLAAKLATLGDGQKKSGAQICAPSQAEIAEEFDVSRRTVQSAKVVVEHGSKDLQHAVESGEVAVSAAAIVAELPKTEQKKIVAKGPEAVKAAAKEIKAEKAAKASAPKKHDDPFDPATMGDPKADLAILQQPYDEMLAALTLIKKHWNQVVGDERDGQYAVHKRQRVLTLIDDLRTPIAQARPHKLYSHCKGKGCDKCKGCGWWPRSVVEGLEK